MEVLKNSLRLIQEDAFSHDIQLETEIAPDIESIVADKLKIKQILFNLLSNAIKFTPDGGTIRLTAQVVDCGRLTAAPLKGAPSHQEQYIQIAIEDTGIGIARENQEKIFDAF